MTEPCKLIQVALPLEAINREPAREKSIRHGHPSRLHLWWARRRLADSRAFEEMGSLPFDTVSVNFRWRSYFQWGKVPA